MANKLNLKIITPKKVAFDREIDQITVPSDQGEITIMPKHINLFSLLKEGVVTIVYDNKENLFSIGGGYVETDGKNVNLLVSRAYGQDELDEEEILKAKKESEKLIQVAKTEEERQQALSSLRRSMIDIKLLQKIKKKR